MSICFKKILDKMKVEKSYLIPLSVFVFLFLFLNSKMSFLYPVNDWSDINVYFNVAKAMNHGRVLYTEVFDHKGPFLFFLYSLGVFISETNYLGMFLIQLFFWLLFAFSLYFSSRLFINSFSSLLATMITICFCLDFMWMGGSAEEFILIFESISLYLFLDFFVKRKVQHNPQLMLIQGILVAAVFFIKLSIILFWFFPLLCIFGHLLQKKDFRNLGQNLLAFVVGVFIVTVPIVVYFVYHQALDYGYYVYIELNRQYSSSNDYLYLLTNGLSKFYTGFRNNLPLVLLYLLGIFYFPFRFIPSKFAATSIMLSGLSLIGMIFFNLTFHFYYPLVLLVFTMLGLVVLFNYLRNVINIPQKKSNIYVASLLVLILCVGKRNFFDMGTDELLRRVKPSAPQFVFEKYLRESENSTLLNLSFGEGNALFTTAHKIPTVKYFFCPNIYYDMFPDIRDDQTKYIEDQLVDYIVSSSKGFNYEYFQTLDALDTHYNLIDSINSVGATYYLYKKK